MAADPFRALEQTTLTDPLVVEMRQSVSEGMHQSRPGFFDNPAVLTNAIADITYDLTVQGASYLDVMIIDPWWQLIQDRGNGKGAFIDTDESGFLQPVEFEFPKGSDRWWYLVAANPTSDLTGANIKLTFEDKQVYLLRSMDKDNGPAKSHVNETRLEFIRRLLKATNIATKEIFSAATKQFEAPPPSFTPAQVAKWDKQWTQQQRDKQRDAAGVAAVTQAVSKGVTGLIDSLFKPPPDPPPISQNAQNYGQQWWAYTQAVLAHPSEAVGTEVP